MKLADTNNIPISFFSYQLIQLIGQLQINQQIKQLCNWLFGRPLTNLAR